MKCQHDDIHPKIAAILLIHVIITVESSDKVSRLLIMGLTTLNMKDVCLIFKGTQFYYS
jgi:hypothetical protein